MSRPLSDALASVLNSSSQVYSGATLTFYSLADVLQDVYTNTDLGTPASTAGVLTANSSGRFPLAYFDPSLDYKAILKDSAGATIATLNPIFKADSYITSSSLTPYLAKAGGTMTGALNEAKGADIASASAINLDNATGNLVHITGTTTIATMTLAAGASRWLIFDGACGITYSSSLLVPGGASITTAANDMCLAVGLGSGVTKLINYQLSDGRPLIESEELATAATDETTAITSGTAKVTFRMPYAMTLTSVKGSLTTAQSSGNLLTIDINEAGTTVLSTKLTFDNNETTTTTAATAAVISDAALASDAEMTIDVDQVGAAGDAAGLKITLIGTRANR